MIRKIIEINEEKCNGCGLCAKACHEGAIGMVEGKARLLRDDYCDGLGDCLPACPTGAISFVEREAAAYDEQAVLQNKKHKETAAFSDCPGSRPKELHHPIGNASLVASSCPSQLRQWPVQIKLAPIQAPYFQNAGLLIAADCSAYTYANFHQD
ncbi:MAG: ATP-binding protein, partial [Clostridium sp.]